MNSTARVVKLRAGSVTGWQSETQNSPRAQQKEQRMYLAKQTNYHSVMVKESESEWVEAG